MRARFMGGRAAFVVGMAILVALITLVAPNRGVVGSPDRLLWQDEDATPDLSMPETIRPPLPTPVLGAGLPDGIRVELLAGASAPLQPAARVGLKLERWELAPGQSAGPWFDSGSLLVVERGALVIAQGAPSGPTDRPIGLFDMGSQVLLPPGTPMRIINESDDAVVVLRFSLEPLTTPIGDMAVPESDLATPSGLDTVLPEMLMSGDVPRLTSGSAFFFIARITLEPGVETGRRLFDGPVGVFVESGDVSFSGPDGADVTINPGNGAVVRAFQPVELRNRDDEAAVVLLVGALPEQREAAIGASGPVVPLEDQLATQAAIATEAADEAATLAAAATQSAERAVAAVSEATTEVGVIAATATAAALEQDSFAMTATAVAVDLSDAAGTATAAVATADADRAVANAEISRLDAERSTAEARAGELESRLDQAELTATAMALSATEVAEAEAIAADNRAQTATAAVDEAATDAQIAEQTVAAIATRTAISQDATMVALNVESTTEANARATAEADRAIEASLRETVEAELEQVVGDRDAADATREALLAEGAQVAADQERRDETATAAVEDQAATIVALQTAEANARRQADVSILPGYVEINVNLDRVGVVSGNPDAQAQARDTLTDALGPYLDCQAAFILTFGHAPAISEGVLYANAVNTLLVDAQPDLFGGAAFDDFANLAPPFDQADIRLYFFSGCPAAEVELGIEPSGPTPTPGSAPTPTAVVEPPPDQDDDDASETAGNPTIAPTGG